MIYKKIITIFFYFIIIFNIFLPYSSWSITLKEQVSATIKKKGDINFGLIVIDPVSNKVILDIHSKRLFIPASLTKIITSYYALEKLGEDYRYKTTIFSDDWRQKGNTLYSNIYLQFKGDPTFTDQDLNKLLSFIKKNKISHIKGDIIIDDNFFNKKWTSPGGFTWDDQPFCQAAPKDSIIINENCSQAFQTPSKIGQLALLEVQRPYILNLKNEVKTIGAKQQDCPYKSNYLGHNSYTVYGCMNNRSNEVKLNFALPDSRKMVGDYILHWLKVNKIKFNGKFKFSKVKGKIIDTHCSVALKEILPLILKDSNNLAAGAVFKTVIAEATKQAGDDEVGYKLLRSFLYAKGFQANHLKIYGGSGESKYNLISPHEMAKVLSKIYKSPKLFKIFTESLPVHAKDGTLKYRSFLKSHSNKIIAKTGNFKTASAIAGYYLGKKKYIFVMMLNNHNLPYAEVKDLEDKALELIFNKLKKSN